jgi:long-chain acyl-CoA synthetase
VVPVDGHTLDRNEIIDFCRKNMANYKVPREIEFRESLPKSSIGKILRRVLRDSYQQL